MTKRHYATPLLNKMCRTSFVKSSGLSFIHWDMHIFQLFRCYVFFVFVRSLGASERKTEKTRHLASTLVVARSSDTIPLQHHVDESECVLSDACIVM